ncbi:Ig-like domain-containing protein [Oligoflexia bacterium]|nr:Ig-like domain-containing protein [Oligoflexia bacterium]
MLEERVALKELGFAIVLVVGCLMLSACSGGGGEQQLRDGLITDTQRYVGTFVNSEGSPLAGLAVTILNSGNQGTTDEFGTADIAVATPLAGDIEVEVAAPWGATKITLFGIHKEAKRVSFQIFLNGADQSAMLIARHVTPPGVDSVAFGDFCLSCHGLLGDADCGNKYWSDIHGGFYNCETNGPSTTNTNCTACHEDLGSPRCGDGDWEAIHLGFFSCKAGIPCTACHEDRGYPKCDSGSWRSFHDDVYDCSKKTCAACHSDKFSRPKCEDAIWIADHTGVYSCGLGCLACHGNWGSPQCNDGGWKKIHVGFFNCDGNFSCTTCHENRGKPLCGDAGFRHEHESFFPCTGQDKCKTCHGNDRVFPKCQDSFWKTIHGNFYSCSKDKNSGTGNCTFCHASSFASPLCGVNSWENIHKFYPCDDTDDGGGGGGGNNLESCKACHSGTVASQCGSASWEAIHAGIWTCE